MLILLPRLDLLREPGPARPWSWLAAAMLLLLAVTRGAHAAPRSPLVEGTSVARIDFRLHNGLITVPVRINGSQELRMYLDTGMTAPVVVLFHRESIIELGLEGTQHVQIGGAGGQQQRSGTLASGASVDIAGLHMTDQTLVVMDESRQTSGWSVDGVIGKSLFDRYITEIDYEESSLTLYDPASAKIVAATSPIPLDLATGIPVIDGAVELEGGKRVSLRFAADLGHRSGLSLSEDAEKGVRAPKRVIAGIAGRGVQGEVPASIGRVSALELGPFTLRDLPAAFLAPEVNAGLGRSLAGGNVGSLVWRRFRIVLDYGGKRMFLVPNADFGKPFPYNMAGLVLEQDRENVYLVRRVLANTPASEAGIREGDAIAAINGVDARDYSYSALLDTFGAAGRKVRLTLRRNGQTLEKTVKLRRLI